MFLKKLCLNDFRNYTQTELEFNKKGNLFFGANGQGKTNLLESIYYLSVYRSFKKGTSKNLANWGTQHFSVSGFFETESGLEQNLSVDWEAGQNKQVFFENDRIRKISELVGLFPVVILSPESMEITQGQPGERRKFIDLCISVVDKEYLQHLIAYKRTLKQRNKILALWRNSSSNIESDLDVWTEKLVMHGSFLIRHRLKAVERLSSICMNKYAVISSGSENLTLQYNSTILNGDDIEKNFANAIERSRAEESKRKVTVVGPHRDDITICLDDHDVRQYASQGQHKTIIMSLKSAEHEFISEIKGFQPAILLDDLFALLDKERILEFLKIIRGYGQFFITANHDIKPETLFSEVGFQVSDFSRYHVERGSIRPQ